MKGIGFSFILITLLLSPLSAQESFDGTWRMTNFHQETKSAKQDYSREELESEGIFWEIQLNSDSTYVQTSNFNKTKKVVKYEGPWQLRSKHRLLLLLPKNGELIPVKYFWEFESDKVMVLERYDPMRTIMLKITFERK